MIDCQSCRLAIGSGVFSAQLIDVVDERLRHPILAGLERMRGSTTNAFTRHVGLEGSEGGATAVKLTIERLDRGEWADDGDALVAFQAAQRRSSSAEPSSALVEAASTGDLDLYQELENELRVTEESLQSTVQEMETTNEESSYGFVLTPGQRTSWAKWP